MIYKGCEVNCTWGDSGKLAFFKRQSRFAKTISPIEKLLHWLVSTEQTGAAGQNNILT